MNYFDDIRPVNNDEIAENLQSLLSDPSFVYLIKTYFPMVNLDQIAQASSRFSNLVEFQNMVIRPILEALISTSATSLTVSGEEHISS